MSDGNLRQLFKKHLPNADWVPVETWSTGRGVPDVNFCFKGGVEGWIENKATTGWRVRIAPEQIAWIERRTRFGGSVFIAVRRRNKGKDELWIIPGRFVRLLASFGLLQFSTDGLYYFGDSGPKSWDWAAVEAYLKKQ